MSRPLPDRQLIIDLTDQTATPGVEDDGENVVVRLPHDDAPILTQLGEAGPGLVDALGWNPDLSNPPVGMRESATVVVRRATHRPVPQLVIDSRNRATGIFTSPIPGGLLLRLPKPTSEASIRDQMGAGFSLLLADLGYDPDTDDGLLPDGRPKVVELSDHVPFTFREVPLWTQTETG